MHFGVCQPQMVISGAEFHARSASSFRVVNADSRAEKKRCFIGVAPNVFPLADLFCFPKIMADPHQFLKRKKFKKVFLEMLNASLQRMRHNHSPFLLQNKNCYVFSRNRIEKHQGW